ncbi:MAG TPA: NADH-quinone oxidoreductase subunit NuoG [Fimbriimonadaceae bacterium]|jgi:NADH-quinone oxidoreductase subunit G
MAAVATTETVNITVNDVELKVPKGEIIVEAVKRLGLEIPIFCYHPRMKPVGMCRMCFVEVGFKGPDGTIKKMPKPQAACTLPASEGMAIYTDTEAVHKDRKGVLELLLINHPLDCPICDRGGECPLQNNTLFYGPSTSRFVELKRHLPKAFPLSKYVTLDLERCIQCGRCVRFTEEISGDSQLAFRFRGAAMQPSTFEMRDFDSKFSGNVIEICPVGALTNAVYRFRARPWDLETKPGICTICSNGCNIWFDYRVGKMVRINGRTNNTINEEWTCDKGKFGHEFYNSPLRLRFPLLRDGDQMTQTDWATAYSHILKAFEHGGNKVAALGGANCSNEDLFMLRRLFAGSFKSQNLDHRFTKTLQTYEQRLEKTLGVSQVQNTIESYEHRNAILVFGTNLADEEPILHLRVRKAWFQNGAKVIVANDKPTDADSFAHLILRYKPGTENALANGLLRAAIEKGGLKVAEPLQKSVSSFTADSVARETGVKASDIVEAGMILAENAAPVISTRSLFNLPDAYDVMSGLAVLGQSTGGGFSLYSLESNDQGCEELGILPDMGPGHATIAKEDRGLDTHAILQGCADGSIKALWLVNVDPFEKHPDRELVTRALENVEFLVYQGIEETEASQYASVVLPMSAPAESDGTYTNMEKRIQRFDRVFPPKGEAKEAWRIYQELLLRTSQVRPFFNAKEVMEEIATHVPGYTSRIYGETEILAQPTSPGVDMEAFPIASLQDEPADS